MKLSVVIPAYNEMETIGRIIERVATVDLEKEIIVVDDGSTDGTREFLQEIEAPGLKVVLHDRNRGKGRAIRTALEHVTGDLVIIQDADLEYDPEDYFDLIAPIQAGQAEVVYGSRLAKKDNEAGQFAFLWGGKMVTLATNILFGSRLTDEPTCYKLIPVKMLREMNLTCEAFEFCPEVTAKILRQGIKILEVPISYHPRPLAEGKKIRAWDGVEAIWTLLKFRFFR